ncbi:hypothetical protein V1525DRAFT_394006 [Lipomyces kononenkoae]|uniref:Uncharacterized protein n=1 Tax=Lipomyces kononenkoae TaxID=34357 RepID=A0ACC3TBM2_LIPKO
MTTGKKRTFKLFTTLLKLLRMRSNDIILEYYDVSVYKADFDNLRDDQWFNDNNLTFWYEYLERSEVYTSLEHPEEIVLLRPSMVFLLAQSANPFDLEGVLPLLNKTRFIFLPINNNADVDLAEGGSHWSLLVVDTKRKTGYYYDTLEDINVQEAEIVAKKLTKLLKIGKMILYSMPTPQQTNGSDCGVMVCMLTSNVLQKIVDAGVSEDLDMHIAENAISPSRGRQLMSYTILDLISKYGRKVVEDKDTKISAVPKQVDGTLAGAENSETSEHESAGAESSTESVQIPVKIPTIHDMHSVV